ncbi:cell envelope biogenesis protein OmpA [Lysobacteraceae bacterium NML03-0222]|nr:cell envelope biogenesis protein OmpA [Xanthomonadaceae bacterium NML03-0222]
MVWWLLSASNLLAQPQNTESDKVIAEGIVPNQATKQSVLERLRVLYGAESVVDRIEVANVPAPAGWGESVTRMIEQPLRQVSKGVLEIRGQDVRISGNVLSETQRQEVASALGVATGRRYIIRNALKVADGGAQKLLDNVLSNRIVEFESGSAQLSARGAQVLDEMANAVKQIGDAKIEIIGHTDSVGDRASNLRLSQDRADAVKKYMIEKNIPANNMTTVGRGSDEPVASNDSAEGRARNRRIEFKVL